MALPAGWLATRLGYKGGIIAGLLMGAVGDRYGMSRAFIVPLACFAFVAFCGFSWSRFSKAGSLNNAVTPAGH